MLKLQQAVRLTLALTFLLGIGVVHGAISDEVYDKCEEHDVSCFGGPPNQQCVLTRDCQMLALYTQDFESQDVTFTLYGTDLGDDSYVAFGINEEQGMPGASVTFCYHSSTSGSGVAMSVNKGHSGSFPLSPDPQYGLSDMSVPELDAESGTLSCSFTRKAVTAITPPGGDDSETVTYDLGKSYYLLMAQGPLSPNMPVQPGYHTSKVVSENKHVFYKRC